MSEPREPRTDFEPERDDKLSTAELAGAGDQADRRADRSAGEPRTFDGPDWEAEGAAPVFPEKEADALRVEWDAIQASFVDEPRRAVEEADHLVAATMKRLAESFAEERARLEGQWDRGDDVSTEDLRVALRRYRSFFTRLLSA
ncbi:hypothetical protein [Phenylobacterium sp.]|uniref:hypothetical protein n=1 Tax=Phenylobacterium sp. TaxID=1871053 RepID=UPI002EDAB88E